MAVYFTPAGRPHCSHCFLDLSGRITSGCCPSCGTWYVVTRARVVPGRYRAMALAIAERAEFQRVLSPIIANPVLRTLSILILVLGNLALVATLAYLAIKPFFPDSLL